MSKDAVLEYVQFHGFASEKDIIAGTRLIKAVVRSHLAQLTEEGILEFNDGYYRVAS
jgi:hypothetical protein